MLRSLPEGGLSPLGITNGYLHCGPPPGRGRIAHFIDNWEKISSDPWVREAVCGVKGHTQTTPQAKARRDGHYQGSDPLQGGRRPGCQGRHHRMCRRRRRVRQPPLSGSEIRRILEASHQSQRPQPLRRSLSLQDGISENGKDHHSERRLDAEVGPKGCLPLCAHSPSPPEVPQVSVGRQAMAVQGPALWSAQCTPNVHQADEASRFHTEETGVPSHPLPG